MFLKTTSGNGSIGEVELAVRIKLRISVIEGGVKQESLQDIGLVVIGAYSVIGNCANLELMLSKIRDSLVEKEETKEEHRAASGSAVDLDLMLVPRMLLAIFKICRVSFPQALNFDS